MKTTIVIDSEGVLTFPDELIKETGWKEGDVLGWIDNQDGSWTLTEITDDY